MEETRGGILGEVGGTVVRCGGRFLIGHRWPGSTAAKTLLSVRLDIVSS